MNNYIPLLVAFLGAFFGTFFAIFKSRNERLWTDRYESLLKIIEISENIRSRFLVVQSDELSIDNYSSAEVEHIEEKWKSARFDLKRESSKIRMLFKEKDIERLSNDIQDLDRAIMNVSESSDENKNHKLNVVWSMAGSCIDEAIQLSRKKCL